MNDLFQFGMNDAAGLSCNNQNQTILNLPETDNLIIKNIDYKTQTIKVNDPKGCLAKRYLDDNFDLSDSPFKLNPEIYNLNLTFLRCPSNITTVSSSSSSSSSSFQFPLTPISCLSNDEKHSNLSSSSSVIVLWAPPFANTTLFGTCEVISTAFVPLPWKDVNMWPFWRDINSDVELVWTNPRCGECALNGQVCGFSEDFKNNLQVQCFDTSSNEGMFFFLYASYFHFQFYILWLSLNLNNNV
jgi:hypothetical protein